MTSIDKPPKRPVGKPPIVPGAVMSRKINVWLTPEMHAMDVRLREVMGITMSELYRYYRNFFHKYGEEDL